MRRDVGLTYDLLRSISTKLSGRKDCRRIEYVVEIHNGETSMDPTIFIYPDAHHRKKYDRCRVLDYVWNTLHSKFSFGAEDLVNGTYIYRWNPITKKRMWTNKYMR